MSKKRGFTLIELLVVISIIAMLLAILMPALGSVKERAKRVVCASNLKQVSIGIATYASSYDDKIPASLFNGSNMPYNAFFAYRINPTATTDAAKITSGPYNFGYLFDTDIIVNPKVFYCPSAPKELNAIGVSFRYETYVGELAWPFTDDPDNYHAQNVRVGYSYYPQSKARELLANGEYGYIVTNVMSKLNGQAVMAVDVLDRLDTLSHKGGRKKPAGVNGLFGDGHVSFCNNNKAFDERLWTTTPEHTPNQDPVAFRTILALLAGSN